MKLIQIVSNLASFDTDDTESTIYASKQWTTDCEAIVAPESEMPPTVIERLNMKYFLDVFIARDFLDDWTASLEKPPTLRERCSRLIHYAIYEA
jgi:hypothetical protein